MSGGKNMKSLMLFGEENDLNEVKKPLDRYFHVSVQPTKNQNGYWLSLREKNINQFLADLNEENQKKLFNILTQKFSKPTKVGRKKIELPSREELMAERKQNHLSVSQLAAKYGCSSTTINRRLGLIKKKG